MNQASAIIAQIHSENLSEEDTGTALEVKIPTLRNWRSQGKGPDYIKIGRSIKYPVDGIRDFLTKKRRKAS